MKIFLACAEESGEQLLRQVLPEIQAWQKDAQIFAQCSERLVQDFPQVKRIFDRATCEVMGFVGAATQATQAHEAPLRSASMA